MGMSLAGKAHRQWDWGCASPGMGMSLIGNAHPHQECTKFTRGDEGSLVDWIPWLDPGSPKNSNVDTKDLLYVNMCISVTFISERII